MYVIFWSIFLILHLITVCYASTSSAHTILSPFPLSLTSRPSRLSIYVSSCSSSPYLTSLSLMQSIFLILYPHHSPICFHFFSCTFSPFLLSLVSCSSLLSFYLSLRSSSPLPHTPSPHLSPCFTFPVSFIPISSLLLLILLLHTLYLPSSLSLSSPSALFLLRRTSYSTHHPFHVSFPPSFSSSPHILLPLTSSTSPSSSPSHSVPHITLYSITFLIRSHYLYYRFPSSISSPSPFSSLSSSSSPL